MILSFRDLEVYKESYALMLEIHRYVFKFPAYESSDLASQMRRASKSCPANIAEGWAKRRFEKEFKKYMEIHIEVAKDLNYWSNELCLKLLERYRNLGGKLVNLQRNWKTN